MRRAARLEQLAQAIRQHDKLHLKDAAALLGVSEMTVRRDLSHRQGELVLLGGYVMLEARSRGASHYLLNDQLALNVDQKRQAARLAAALAHPHQTLFFDCGTTTPLIIEAIDDGLPFTGVCYSLNTFLALQAKPLCRVLLCGGEFCASNAIFKPLNFAETLNNVCPDIAFFSAAGVHAHYGVTCYNLDELPVKQWALNAAQRKVLVVDSSKFGQVRPANMGSITQFDMLISDSQPDLEIQVLAAQSDVVMRWK